MFLGGGRVGGGFSESFVVFGAEATFYIFLSDLVVRWWVAVDGRLITVFGLEMKHH